MSESSYFLGTVITEWTDGEKLWQQIYENDDKMNLMITKLVQICKHCKFDGYLINIENKVPEEHLDKMKLFVEMLTLQIHEEVKDSLVIWYDSVISPSGMQPFFLIYKVVLSPVYRKLHRILSGLILLDFCVACLERLLFRAHSDKPFLVKSVRLN